MVDKQICPQELTKNIAYEGSILPDQSTLEAATYVLAKSNTFYLSKYSSRYNIKWATLQISRCSTSMTRFQSVFDFSTSYILD